MLIYNKYEHFACCLTYVIIYGVYVIHLKTNKPLIISLYKFLVLFSGKYELVQLTYQ